MSPFIRIFSYSLPVLVLIGVFNYLVDPYGIYNTLHVNGFNFPKAEAQNYEKLVKAYLVSEIQPDAVVMGTSRAGIGIDSDSELWAGDGAVFNLSIADGNVYVTRRFLQHLIAIRPPKKVVLGLDFFVFNAMRSNANDYSENLLAVDSRGQINDNYKWHIILSSIFSYSAVKTSIKTIRKIEDPKINILNPDSGMRQYAINGKIYHSDELIDLPVIDHEDAASLVFGKVEKYYMSEKYYLGESREYAFENSDIGNSTIREFRKIVRLCLENDIELFMFISPTHARQTEAIRAIGLWPLFEQWKRGVVQVLEQEYGSEEYRLWDFSGYNSVTSVEVITGRMREYKDPSHYLPFVGDMVLSRLFGEQHVHAPAGFGRRLHGGNIEQVLELMRLEQREYHDKHAKTIRAVEALAASLGMGPESVEITGGDRPVAARSVPRQ